MKGTVGIVAYNEENKIADLLVSLTLESNRTHIEEIIIIDNGSTDKTAEVLSDFQKNSPIKMTLKSNPDNVLGQSRQAIVDACTTPILFFVDADCIVPEKWAETLIYHFIKMKNAYPNMAGVCGPNRLPKDKEWQQGTNQFLDLPFGNGGSAQAKIPYTTEPTDHLPTTNALFDVETLKKAGGFDKTLKFGEDSELGYRMRILGFEMFLCPNPIVINRSADTIGQWAKRMVRFGQCQWLHARNRSLVFIFLLIALLVHLETDDVLEGTAFLLLVFGALIFTRAKEFPLSAAAMGMLTVVSYVAGFLWGTVGFVLRFARA